jgi:predicted dehydrogenase
VLGDKPMVRTPADLVKLQQAFAVAKEKQVLLTPAQFKQVTGAGSFPAYLANDVRDGQLHVYSNGEFTYRLKGVHARVAATWAYESPPGSGDTHDSAMRGRRASLTIRQGETEKFKPVLYVERHTN